MTDFRLKILITFAQPYNSDIILRSSHIKDSPAPGDMPQYDPFHESFGNDAAWGEQIDEHDAAGWINNAKYRTSSINSALSVAENDNKVNPAQKLSQPPTFCACSCTCCQQGRETPSSQAPQCLLSSPSQKVPTSDDALSGCHSPIIKAASMRTEPFFSTYPTFGRRSTVSNEKLGEWVRKQDGDSIQGADSDNGRSIEKSLGAWL